MTTTVNAPSNPTPSPQGALVAQLTKYAAYHRDPRNIATHYVGVPMIVLSVVSFLSRPAFEVAGLMMSPLWLVLPLVTIFYLRLDVRFGLTMLLILSGLGFVASFIAAQSTIAWAIGSAALFIVGWVIQFIGHYYEGKKPAFVDDLIGLLIGPLFVTAEIGFNLGLRHDVKNEIESKVGPTRLRTIGSTGQPTLSK
jgi:uncharacterized membrane protein YGL010W